MDTVTGWLGAFFGKEVELKVEIWGSIVQEGREGTNFIYSETALFRYVRCGYRLVYTICVYR